jgi:enamine deaminase RidA (YjgF/YER057c/UK114 family)
MILEYPEAQIVALSEEHGTVDFSAARAGDGAAEPLLRGEQLVQRDRRPRGRLSRGGLASCGARPPSVESTIAMSYEAKLQELGYTLEPVEMNTGKFMLAVRTGNLIYTAGSVSRFGGEEIKGKVGADLTVEQGYAAARLATLAALNAIKTLAGSLDNVVRVVKVLGMVNVAPGFDNTPGVIHGCSDLLLEVFGEAGRHARSAVGMTIPFNFAVEVELIAEVS